uniref:Uncharacterized protein n=1 Tax=Oryza brachyantha TaxID=4533 RepID=J3MDM3_ORYBR
MVQEKIRMSISKDDEEHKNHSPSDYSRSIISLISQRRRKVKEEGRRKKLCMHGLIGVGGRRLLHERGGEEGEERGGGD